MRYGKHDYCAYSILDNIAEYKKEDIKIGFYYVVSDNVLPLKGNGWYSYVLAQFCLDNNIIYKHNIRYAFYPSLTMSILIMLMTISEKMQNLW